MNGDAELRMQVALDRIARMHDEAARERFARRASRPLTTFGTRRSLGALFGRSLRALVAGH